MSTEPRRLGKYELRERLARGGQGEVWKAFDLQLRRYVAIKQLNANFQADPSFNSRFEREAQFIASLHHPNIVQIHDFQFVHTPDSNTATAYMIMEYIDGPTLAEYIRDTSRKREFPAAAALVSIFTAVSLALDYAHKKGMIHRDIKPANIMLDKRSVDGKLMGKPVLMDFGIAKLQGASADTTKVLGTPLYVSPEQAQGLPGDKQSDLYSLGIILYEITTGVTPFRGDSLMEILMRHYQDIPTPPSLINPDIPAELSNVILKSIAKDPEARFPSASAMTIALADALHVPVPPELWKSSVTPAATNVETDYNPLSLSGNTTPASLSPYATYPVQTSSLASPLAFVPSANGIRSADRNAAVSAPANTNNPPQQVPVSPSPVPQHTGKRSKKSLYIASSILLVVLGLGLVSYVLFASKRTNPPPIASPVVGHVLFLSSPHVVGVLDEVQISLGGMHDAPSDKSYYAWLETHSENIEPVHWALSVHNGRLTSSSYVDQQHNNLLPSKGPYRFLITLQGMDTVVPSFNSTDHLYYAVIPQTESATDNFSVVDHLHHLLTDDPNLDKLGMSNGLRFWLLANTQALVSEANSARTAWQNKDIPTLRQRLVNMLYYLEGTSCAPSEMHTVPRGTPATPDTNIEQSVKVSLLDCTQNTIISGLLSHIETHVRGIVQAPGATRTQMTLAPQIQAKIVQVSASLEQLHQDMLQLLQLPDDQLLQPSEQSQLEQVVVLANKAYSGQTTSPQAGVVQIGDDLQQLATFDIMPCPRSASNICTS
ncbi:MAG: hypothetical protein NVSMB38_32820 [Ktedonobacteraceae bacterium]